jgi:hypothetical protein
MSDSYANEKLMKHHIEMREVIAERDKLIACLVDDESRGYELSDREKEQGGLDTYSGMPLEDEKQDRLKEISLLTSWIEYQKDRVYWVEDGKKQERIMSVNTSLRL